MVSSPGPGRLQRVCRGDAWEHKGGANRFISIAIPLFFVLFAWTLDEVRKAAAGPRVRKDALTLSHVVMILLVLFSMGNFNALLSDWKNVERWMLRRRAAFIAGNEQNVIYALDLEKITAPDARLAVVGAGTTPYFLPDRYAIDLLGKADPVIVHGPIRSALSIAAIPTMRPGHMKWDYAYSIGTLKPDVIVSLWDETLKEFEPYRADYVAGGRGDKIWFLLRKDSPYILWDKVVIEN